MQVGFKRIGLSASDYEANIPIKKRRFPGVQLTPSPSKDISSFHSDGNLLKVEQPSPPKDVSSFNHNENLIKSEEPILSVTTVSSSSVVTSCALSNNNQDSVSEEKKGKSDTDSCCVDIVQSNIGAAGVKFQEPSLGRHACTDGFVECEGKSLVTVEHTDHASPVICAGLKLLSTSLDSDHFAGNKEEEIDVKMPEENCSPPICQLGGAGVLVGLKGHMDLKLVSEKSDLNFLKQNSMEPVLLNFALNKQGSSTQCVKGNVGFDCDGSFLQSNREKWDLNTSMESWEGCTSGDAPVVQISATRTNTTIETYSCSSEMVESDSPCGKQTLLDNEDKGDSTKEHLHLSLDSSYLKSVLDEDPYISEYESDGNWDIAETVDDNDDNDDNDNDDNDNNVEEDYEDGEVRETMQETEVEVHVYEKREIEPLDHAGCNDKKINSVGLLDHEFFTLGPKKQETKLENLDYRSEDEDEVQTTTKSNSYEQENEDLCVKELHAVENAIGEDVNISAKATERSQLSQYDKKGNFEGQGTADKILNEEPVPTFSQNEVENAVAVDVVQNRDLTLPTVKESVNEDNAKDINGGTRNSRIINFNRTSTDSTPCKAKSNFAKPVLSHKDREFVPNMVVERANMKPQER